MGKRDKHPSPAASPPRVRYLLCTRWKAALILSLLEGGGIAGSASLVIAQRSLMPSADPTTVVEPFHRVHSIRALADGRVLVGEWWSPGLTVVDVRSGRVEPVALPGVHTPGAREEVSRVLALTGDSTLVEDRRNGRWHLLSGTRVVGTVASVSRPGRGPNLIGADRTGDVLELRGFVYAGQRPNGFLRIPETADSTLLLRYRRAPARSAASARSDVDTLARLRGRWRGARTVYHGSFRGAPLRFELQNPLAVEEQAVLFPDGWVALVRLEPYHVEWITPTRQRIVGPPLPNPMILVDSLQMRHAIHVYSKGGGLLEDFAPSDFPAWPSVLPPFHNDALLASPSGLLLIRRTADARRSVTAYDIIDRQGHLTGRLELQLHERVVGFGPRSMYVVAKRKDGQEQLRIHQWRLE